MQNGKHSFWIISVELLAYMCLLVLAELFFQAPVGIPAIVGKLFSFVSCLSIIHTLFILTICSLLLIIGLKTQLVIGFLSYDSLSQLRQCNRRITRSERIHCLEQIPWIHSLPISLDALAAKRKGIAITTFLMHRNTRYCFFGLLCCSVIAATGFAESWTVVDWLANALYLGSLCGLAQVAVEVA
jgi:hypothetical protein